MEMADREKVIKGLEKLRNTFRDFREWYEEQIVTDALDLLKEQEEEIQNLRRENHNILTQFHEWAKEHEAKPPTLMQDINGIFATCPMCGHKLHAIIAMEIDTYLPKYCSECGQAVKWNESEG